MGEGDGESAVGLASLSHPDHSLTCLSTRLRISSLYSLGIAIRDVEALLLMDKPPIKRPTTNASTAKKTSAKPEKESYNRDLYWSYVADKKTAFLKLYGFCFALAKSAWVFHLSIFRRFS